MTACLPHPLPSRAHGLAAWRRHLLVGCAFGGALALLAVPQRAEAQAFNANPSTGNDVTFSRFNAPTPGSETITVNQPTATINWFINPPAAPGDPYIFLPQGNTATFQNGSGTANFAVLNRIFGSNGSPVRFDGNVVSRLTDIATGASLGAGGTVIFQNSGGIIVGATATFDIGNLVLTTLTVSDSGYGDFLNDGGGLDMFGADSPYDQAIVVEAADIAGRNQIVASAEGSYVVFAAPRIVQGGNVRVNGNVGYAAGEGVVFTVNDGLFDIQLRQGSDNNSTPIIHTGSTGGPASTGAGDRHRIYMLTAGYSSSQAVTMLLGGEIGFDEAASASVENGQIVLSSGLLSQFDPEEGGYGAVPHSLGDIEISGGSFGFDLSPPVRFTSNVDARATGSFYAEAVEGDISFLGDLVVVANESARINAIDFDIDIAGDVSLTSLGEAEFGYGGQESFLAAANGLITPAAVNVFGQTVEITADNGQTVTIGGNVSLNASAAGGFESSEDPSAGSGSGGTVRVEVGYGGGAISIGGDLEMLATGAGAVTTYSPDSGGDGIGGTAYITAINGDITVGGATLVDVSGAGSRSNGLETAPGTGQGGSVFVSATRGTVTLTGAGTFIANGTGGELEGPEVQGRGGIGQGGTVDFRASAEGGTIAMGAVSIENSGFGGNGVTGGDATGGQTNIVIELGYGGIGNAGEIRLAGLDIETSGFAGDGSEFTGGIGGTGEGGEIDIYAPRGSIIVSGPATASANGFGGAGVQGGGTGIAGQVTVEADQGAIEFGGLTTLAALGFGGDGTGNGAAGGLGTNDIDSDVEDPDPNVQVIARNGGSVTAAAFDLSAQGSGGRGADGNANAAGGVGGVGQGGNIFVYSETGGTIEVAGRFEAKSSGNGGDGGADGGLGAGDGGDGLGGIIRVGAGQFNNPATALISMGEGVFDVSSRGGVGADGGVGSGGDLQVGTFGGGEMNVAGRINIDSIGRGGEGLQGAGGEGRGGRADLFVRGGTLTFAEAVVRSDGFGGDGLVGGNGLAGFSADTIQSVQGGAFLTARDGTISGGSGSVSAQGVGGSGSAGAGGNGRGGTAEIVALNGTTASLVDLGSASLDISAQGGSGGPTYNGGSADIGLPNAISGLVTAQGINGSLSIESLTVRANATGGAGGAPSGSLAGRGGDAAAGRVQFGAVSGVGNGPSASTVTFGTIDAQAAGTGGAGGGNGGNGTGGTLFFTSSGALVTSGAVSMNVDGRGGNAGAGTGATGGTGQGGQASILARPRFQTASFQNVTMASVTISADGFGGAAGASGTGGLGAGGAVEISALGAGATGTASVGDLDLTANGEGGQGRTGGDGTGGTVTLQAQGIALTFGNAALAASGRGGAGLAIPAGPGTPGLGAGGALEILSIGTGGTITGTSLAGTAGGFGTSSEGNSAGRWLVSVSPGGGISVGTVQLDAVAEGALVGGQTSQINVNDGVFDVGTSGAFFTQGQTEINASGTGQVTGGDLLFRGTGLLVTHSDRGSNATVDADSFTAQVGTDFFGGTGTLIRASDRIDIEPDGIAVIGGTLVAPEIFIRSADIEITDTGFIGGPDTNLVRLTVVPGFGEDFAQQVTLGGTEDGYGEGYTLTNAEAGRIRTGTLALVSSLTGTAADRDPDLLIRDLTLSATPGQTGAAVNRLEISFAAGEGGVTTLALGNGGRGIVQVEGALRLENAGATSGIEIDAGQRIQVINPSGSIRVLAGGGAPGGSVALHADDIWSASQAIIDQLLANLTFTGRNEALLAPPSQPQERGFIEGGEVTLAVSRSLLVQNSGPAGAFGGITVGAGGLTVQAAGSGVDVYAFGRRADGGAFVTNSAFFRETEFGYGSAYAAAAEFNQCIIATGACPDDPVIPEPPVVVPIGAEIIEGPIDEAEESVPPPNPDRQEFVDVSFASESLLEEPVTSGGDSSTWDEDCEPGPEGAECRAQQQQPAGGN